MCYNVCIYYTYAIKRNDSNVDTYKNLYFILSILLSNMKKINSDSPFLWYYNNVNPYVSVLNIIYFNSVHVLLIIIILSTR
jgi:hypothetical protein